MTSSQRPITPNHPDHPDHPIHRCTSCKNAARTYHYKNADMCMAAAKLTRKLSPTTDCELYERKDFPGDKTITLEGFVAAEESGSIFFYRKKALNELSQEDFDRLTSFLVKYKLLKVGL